MVKKWYKNETNKLPVYNDTKILTMLGNCFRLLGIPNILFYYEAAEITTTLTNF